MTGSQWRSLTGVDFAPLREARMEAYYAAQWLARAARGYIRPRPDDGHTNLGWNDAFDGFTTHPLAGDTRLGLRLPDLTLALLEGGKAGPALSLQGHSETDVRQWLGRQMAALGFADNALDAALPYELPAHALGRGGHYEAAKRTAPLRELAAWYANGFRSLDAIKQRLRAQGLPAPEVRCWPHHFDLDCLTPVGNGGKAPATMGAGFSPGDHYYDEPYFYISIYPRPDASRLPVLQPLGHWHTADFLAALVPASRILGAKDRQAETEAFLHSATDGIVKLLSHPVAPP